MLKVSLFISPMENPILLGESIQVDQSGICFFLLWFLEQIQDKYIYVSTTSTTSLACIAPFNRPLLCYHFPTSVAPATSALRRQGLPKRHAAVGHRWPCGGGQGLGAAAAAEKPATPGERLGSPGFHGGFKNRRPWKPWVPAVKRLILGWFGGTRVFQETSISLGTRRWEYKNWDIDWDIVIHTCVRI